MELFKKSEIVGVAITPERGLEVAQIDFTNKRVLKYGVRALDFDLNRKEISDMDIFKETLQDLFLELQIPKNVEIVVSIPTVIFKINDYPAALDEAQVSNAIEEEVSENHIFDGSEASMSAVLLPNSSMQFNKIAYAATHKPMLIEMAMIIKSLGYKLAAIEPSVNASLNALIYKERVDAGEDVSWVFLIVENYVCRVILMNGNNYVDVFEEKISIGAVLGDAENYSTVISAVEPLLKNLPSKYLYVLSKTDVISAEVLASKLSYSANIIHCDANRYAKEDYLEFAPTVDVESASVLTLDVIGAAIYREFQAYTAAHFNLFNKYLGDVFLAEQPPEISFAGRTIILSNEFLIKAFILILVLVCVPVLISFSVLMKSVADYKAQNEDLDIKIAERQKFLKENESVSSDLFDEGDEIRAGLVHNKNIYSYYTIVGTEIPKKLWLTYLKFNDKVTIEGQADNLESVYAFFRSIKDYNPASDIKLQKLGLAASSKQNEALDTAEFDTDSILTSMNADFYEFRISNAPEISKDKIGKDGEKQDNSDALPDLETIKE